MKDHPNRLTLERFSVQDLPAEQAERVSQHLSSCETCRLYLDDLAGFEARRRAAVPPARFLAGLRERREGAVRGRWKNHVWFGGLAVAVASAAAVAMLLIPSPAMLPPEDPVSDIRLKGSGITIHRKRGVETRVLVAGDRIRAGDGLRIVVTLSRPEPVGAWFVDSSGQVDRFLAQSSVVLGAGEHALPGSATVEAPCKDLWLVVATGPAANEDMEAALRRVAKSDLTGTNWAPEGARVWSLRCE